MQGLMRSKHVFSVQIPEIVRCWNLQRPKAEYL